MNIVVDEKYSVINSDPKLDFFAISVSARDAHTRALAVFFNALYEILTEASNPLDEDGIYTSSKKVYAFGKQMTGEYLFYVVGRNEYVKKFLNEFMELMERKGSNLENMGKAFDKMSAQIPRIASYPSPVYALYKFVWERLLRIEPVDDVDVMYLNKISLILQKHNIPLMLTSLGEYETNVVDRPILLVNDVPMKYEFVDKLVEGVSYVGKLFLQPLKSVSDVFYGYLAKMWYEERGYRVIFERIRDYLLLYVYGIDQPPKLPSGDLLENYVLFWREMLADPIYRIRVLATAGHVLVSEDIEVYNIIEWDDAIQVEFIVKGRDSGARN